MYEIILNADADTGAASTVYVLWIHPFTMERLGIGIGSSNKDEGSSSDGKQAQNLNLNGPPLDIHLDHL